MNPSSYTYALSDEVSDMDSCITIDVTPEKKVLITSSGNFKGLPCAGGSIEISYKDLQILLKYLPEIMK